MEEEGSEEEAMEEEGSEEEAMEEEASEGSDGMPPTSEAMFQPRKRKKSTAVDEDCLMKLRTCLDAEIARMFYSSGLPFKLARNPDYVRLFSTPTSDEEEDESQDDRHSLTTQMFLSEG
uniref:Uncharacterized protein n=1 Tax=Leersia perrieri TaxID=77586 RepID=A0A0D9WGI6_9ORYZ